MFLLKTDRDKAFDMGRQVLQHIFRLLQVHLTVSVLGLDVDFRLLFLVSIVDNTFGGDEAGLECDTQGTDKILLISCTLLIAEPEYFESMLRSVFYRTIKWSAARPCVKMPSYQST